MIDPKDFPFRTPQDNLREALRLARSFRSSESLEEEARAQDERADYLYEKYVLARMRIDPATMSLEELLERFEEICLVQHEAQLRGEEGLEQYRGCYAALDTIDRELKRRGVEARRALLRRLYDHFDPHVRLKAATRSYRVAPEEARRCLTTLQNANIPHASLAAGMTLSSIDAGTSMLE